MILSARIERATFAGAVFETLGTGLGGLQCDALPTEL
jgi:hypothetical protein